MIFMYNTYIRGFFSSKNQKLDFTYNTPEAQTSYVTSFIKYFLWLVLLCCFTTNFSFIGLFACFFSVPNLCYVSFFYVLYIYYIKYTEVLIWIKIFNYFKNIYTIKYYTHTCSICPKPVVHWNMTCAIIAIKMAMVKIVEAIEELIIYYYG